MAEKLFGLSEVGLVNPCVKIGLNIGGTIQVSTPCFSKNICETTGAFTCVDRQVFLLASRILSEVNHGEVIGTDGTLRVDIADQLLRKATQTGGRLAIINTTTGVVRDLTNSGEFMEIATEVVERAKLLLAEVCVLEQKFCPESITGRR